ncbi:MAG TPA: hypothetical protein VFE73_15895, partial [Reyranella sp.]|nr:hypothetical protein [Reyranella sp.]
MSTPVIAVVILGSIAAVLAVGLVIARLITRRSNVAPVEPGKTDESPSPWPQTSLQRIKDETARR